MVDTTRGEWVGALLLFMLALAFLVVYLAKRSRLWALLVAYICAVAGVAPLMAARGAAAAYFGPLFLLAVALPFYIVYFRSAERWWAIIPAGALTSAAVVAVPAIANTMPTERAGAYASALMLGGLAATFAVVWLRHAKAWAQVVTLGLAALAVLSLFLASYSQVLWSLAIILAGVYLLYRAWHPSAHSQK